MAVLINCSPEKDHHNLYTIQGNTMGTTFTIKLVKEPKINDYRSVEDKISGILKQVNLQMSTYIEDSEISRFNRYKKTEWFPISVNFATVLKHSLQISSQSAGAFDITVGPLVNLWGFGPTGRPDTIPDELMIEKNLSLVGYQNLELRQNPAALKKYIPDLNIDLSAIAKGFCVDKVAEYLDSLEQNNYMIEIGGEIRTRGKNHQNSLWRIGIQSPDKQQVYKVIRLLNNSMATSGDYMNYFEKDGIRYSHTIDPETGRPVFHNLASVTVIHKSCMIADALATAINVMGEEKGFDFAIQQELSIFMLVRNDKGVIEKVTPSFKKYLN
jgi:thiamine biosynthesis lipoprotein